MEEEEIVSVRTAQKWFKKFSEGHTDLRDEPRSGCPMTVNTEAIRAAVEANPSTSTRRLSAELDIPQTSVVRHLKAIGKVNRRCQEVPHDLTENQTQNRVDICRKLLQNPHDDRFIGRIVTCNEKWVYFNNPDKQNQWLEVAQPVAKRDRFSRKALLCVWWNFEGIIHFELVPNGRTINADLYCAQLDRMYAELGRKYPALFNRKRNRPSTARQSKTAHIQTDERKDQRTESD